MRLDVSLPKSWEELSQEQLRFLLDVIATIQDKNQNVAYRDHEDFAAQTHAQVATILFLEWAGIKIVCPYSDGYLLRLGDTEFMMTAGTMTAAIAPLSWAKDLPLSPVRLDTIDGASAIPADISEGLSFDSWLACENNWQVYQSTLDVEWLRKMAAILYNKEDIALDQAETLSIFYWWAAVKNMVSAMFPNFFHSSGSSEASEISIDSIRRNMDAQIRALTKGDITKESEILSMNALRALTELDAQAREYDELNRKYPKK